MVEVEIMSFLSLFKQSWSIVSEKSCYLGNMYNTN
jgi:hypothetical protein